MSQRYDVIVIGAGHNGLTTTALLAEKGFQVLVLERRAVVGGLAAGEAFHPGYRSEGLLHDTGRVRPWVVEALALRHHGLELRPQSPALFLPEVEGPGLLLESDADKAHAELATRCDQDARSYRDFRAFLGRIAPVLRRVVDQPPADLSDPSFADLLRLGRAGLSLRGLGARDMMEVLRIAPMCVADWLNEYFEDELLKTGLAATALEGCWAGPWSPGTVTNFLWLESMVERQVVGGGAALVAALDKAVRAHGATVRCNAAVEEVLPGDGTWTVRLAGGESFEAGKVAAACDPRQLFLDLLPSTALSASLEREASLIRARGITAKVHLALSGYPSFAGRPDLRPEWIRIGDSLDDLERSFDPVKYRQMAIRPALDIRVPTVAPGAPSRGLAPDGHHVVSILAHGVPQPLEGGWNETAKETLYRTVVETLARYAPGVESLIVGQEVISPLELESTYGTGGGHLFHGEHAIDQLLVRPAPGCTGYRTPIPGLFLCGSGSHPGGGLTCAPGALAARTILSAG